MTTVPVVLVVEDDPGSVDLYRNSLAGGREGPTAATMTVATNGVDAIRWLLDHSAARPDLVLLDLSMPDRGGHEVLAVIRSDARLSSVPVVVFTSSADLGDVDLSYALGANCHVVKPSDPTRCLEVVRQIEDFWLHTATLPPAPAPVLRSSR